jgi:hypothetical protein
MTLYFEAALADILRFVLQKICNTDTDTGPVNGTYTDESDCTGFVN